jgi:hypothetical protein
LNELRSLLTKIERLKSVNGHRGLYEAAPETLEGAERANQAKSDFSPWEAEPAPSASF